MPRAILVQWSVVLPPPLVRSLSLQKSIFLGFDDSFCYWHAQYVRNTSRHHLAFMQSSEEKTVDGFASVWLMLVKAL